MLRSPVPHLATTCGPSLCAHRLRGAVTAGLIRDLIRWISMASR